MTAPVPSDLWARIRAIVAEEIRRFWLSGPLRNASISDGGLTIKGGFLRLLHNTVTLFHVGPYGPNLPDGSPQQGMALRRADGSLALDMRDAFPADDGTLNQALAWWDRSAHVVVADDTDSGEGLARPYIPAAFYPARSGDWPGTTSGAYEGIYRAELPKQHPRLRVAAYVAADAGTTGQMICTVEGAQFGATVTVVGGGGGAIAIGMFGPDLLPTAEHMSTLHVELHARRDSGGGTVRVAPIQIQGMQS